MEPNENINVSLDSLVFFRRRSIAKRTGITSIKTVEI